MIFKSSNVRISEILVNSAFITISPNKIIKIVDIPNPSSVYKVQNTIININQIFHLIKFIDKPDKSLVDRISLKECNYIGTIRNLKDLSVDSIYFNYDFTLLWKQIPKKPFGYINYRLIKYEDLNKLEFIVFEKHNINYFIFPKLNS